MSVFDHFVPLAFKGLKVIFSHQIILILMLYFKVTPVLGVIAVLLVLVVVREPKRGAIEVLDTNEDDEDITETPVETEHSTYLEDLKKIFCV